MAQITRPFDLLNNALQKQVLVRLKEQKQFRGRLVAFDQHMNLVLEEAEEINENGEAQARIGTIILRGDNIIYVSP